jgi:hypothetical protein
LKVSPICPLSTQFLEYNKGNKITDNIIIKKIDDIITIFLKFNFSIFIIIKSFSIFYSQNSY